MGRKDIFIELDVLRKRLSITLLITTIAEEICPRELAVSSGIW
jgi:hypothetical protein